MHRKIYSVTSNRTGEKISVEDIDLPPTIIYPGMPVCYDIEKTTHGYKASHITFVGGYDD